MNHKGMKCMNESMRRSERQLTDEETLRLFHEVEYGVLSLIDENNVPYGVPMSFALCDHVIYFHCSAAGGKRISGIRHDPNACFTVIKHTKLLPQQFATLYMSGIAYGTIEIVSDETEKRKGIEAILHKYSSDYIEKGMKYIDAALDKIYVLRFEIEKITGKGRKA